MQGGFPGPTITSAAWTGKRTGILGRRMAARSEHLKCLRKGRERWNQWRRRHPNVQRMLAGGDASAHFKGRRHSGQIAASALVKPKPPARKQTMCVTRLLVLVLFLVLCACSKHMSLHQLQRHA
jgi:hypothetical protein